MAINWCTNSDCCSGSTLYIIFKVDYSMEFEPELSSLVADLRMILTLKYIELHYFVFDLW